MNDRSILATGDEALNTKFNDIQKLNEKLQAKQQYKTCLHVIEKIQQQLEDMTCLITATLPSQPVYLSMRGDIYECASVLDLLKKPEPTHPKTRQPIHILNIIPVKDKRKKIIKLITEYKDNLNLLERIAKKRKKKL